MAKHGHIHIKFQTGIFMTLAPTLGLARESQESKSIEHACNELQRWLKNSNIASATLRELKHVMMNDWTTSEMRTAFPIAWQLSKEPKKAIH